MHPVKHFQKLTGTGDAVVSEDKKQDQYITCKCCMRMQIDKECAAADVVLQGNTTAAARHQHLSGWITIIMSRCQLLATLSSEQCFARVLSSQPRKRGCYEDRRDYSCCIIIQKRGQTRYDTTHGQTWMVEKVGIRLQVCNTPAPCKYKEAHEAQLIDAHAKHNAQAASLRLQHDCAMCVIPTVQPPNHRE